MDLDVTDIGAIAVSKTLLQPAKRFFFLIQAEVQHGPSVRDHFAMLSYFFKLSQCLLCCILVARFRFSCGKKRQHEWIVRELPCFFVLANCSGEIAFRLENKTEIVMRVEEFRIEFERFSKLRDRFIVATGVIKGIAKVGIDNWR